MAKKIILEPSRTLHEFRLLPGLTTEESVIEKVSLKSPLVYSDNPEKEYNLNIPLISAAMQSVSGVKMGIELATQGGAACIFCSQPIVEQAAMISKIKNHKAGFVEPITVRMEDKIKDLAKTARETGYSIFPVIDGEGIFAGLISKNDYEISRHGELLVKDRMIEKKNLEIGVEINDLKEANSILIESHQSVLPITDSRGKLKFLVFRKDIRNFLNNPSEVTDNKKRLLAVAAINTHDYQNRIPALAAAGVDVISIDSSDGHSVFQEEVLTWISKNYPYLPVIAGNVITQEGFDFLVANKAKAVKVGMGGGSICITQEQKGTGRGLATAIMQVVEARNAYYNKTGIYIPVIADGGIGTAKEMIIALALGADSIMMGRYFARMDESPTEKVEINNRIMKPYWGEGSGRAREWKSNRYNQSKFVEGVEGFVEYAGKLKDNLEETSAKIKAALSSCGVSNIRKFHEAAILELVSALSIREGMVHDIYLPGNDNNSRFSATF